MIRILVLDDEAAVGRSLKRLLGSAGFEVATALNAEQARMELSHGDVGVLISDERMPGQRGVDFLQECSRDFPQVIRIMLTGYADPATAAEAVNRAEIFRLLFKPWSDEELVAVVREASWKYALLQDEIPTLRSIPGGKM
jgi:DNA-binding NtrC family response regulator